MAEIVSVATALPTFMVRASDAKAEIDRHFPPASALRYGRMVDASGIGQRYSVLPLAGLVRLQGVEQRNELYREHCLALGEEVARSALREARIDAGSIQLMLSVSCTGYMMPSLDAHLIGRLGIPPFIHRVPITELGCSAGVAGLGLAEALLRSLTPAHGLIVSVELSSLNGQADKPTAVDMLANMLFGDAAAAVVVSAVSAGRGPEIVMTARCLLPDSLEHLGVRLTDSGFRAFLSSELPKLIRRNLQPWLHEILKACGHDPAEIAFWIVHPGGPKVLEAVSASLGLSDDALRPSWEVLEQFGNLSSATTFFVLKRLSKTQPPAPGALGIMLAFGPGVSCEVALLRAGGWLTRRC